MTDDGERLIGRSIPDNRIDGVLKALGYRRKAENITAQRVLDALAAGERVILSDGAIIKKRRVSGETRIEYAPKLNNMNEARFAADKGMFSERIQYATRYFIPVAGAGEILESVLKEKPALRFEGTSNEVDFYRGARHSENGMWKAQRDSGNTAGVRSVSDIISGIRKSFDLPIRTGHYKGAQLGQYNNRTDVIRTRMANDLPVVSHELGHALDKIYRFSEMPEGKQLVMLLPEEFRSAYSKKELPREAFAEFLREYLRTRATAKEKFGEFYDLFENRLSARERDIVQKLAQDINAYFSASTMDKMAVHVISAKEAEKREKQKLREKLRHHWRGMRRYFADDMEALERFEKEMGFFANGKSDKNPYELALMARTAEHQAAWLLDGDLRDMHGNPIANDAGNAGKSYFDRLKPVADRISEFDLYLAAKHGKEILELRPEVVVFNDPELNSVGACDDIIGLLESENPDFKEVSEDIYDFLDQVYRAYGIDSGLESEELYAHLREIYPYYVPFRRAMPGGNEAVMHSNVKRGYVNQSSVLRRLKGSGLDIVSPTAGIVGHVMRIVKAASRNRVGIALAQIADTAEGIGHIIERVEPDKAVQKFSLQAQKEKLFEAIYKDNALVADPEKFTEILDGIFDDTLMKFIPYAKGSAGIVSVRRNGKNVYYQINDENLYRAVTSIDRKNGTDATMLLRAMQIPLKFGAVVLNPTFFARNGIRDFGTAWFKSYTLNPAKFLYGYCKAVKSMLALDEDYKRFLALGGGHNARLTLNADYVSEALKKRVRKDPVGAAEMLKGFLTNLRDGFTHVGEFIETVPRFQEYRGELGRSGDEVYAMYRAGDITTNFNRHGAGEMDSFFLFGNAAVQGLDGARRKYTDESAKRRNRTIIKKVMTGVVFSAIAAALSRLEPEKWREEMEKISSYTKNNNYVIPFGDGRFLKLPKPREEAVYLSLMERSIEYLFGNDDAFYEFGEYACDTLLPPFMPTDFRSPDRMFHSIATNSVFGSITDVMTNMDYKGDPIVPRSMEYLNDGKHTARDQYNGSTSKLAIAAGNLTGWSPMKIDYLFQSSLGWLGRLPQYLAPQDESRTDFLAGTVQNFIGDSAYSTDVFSLVYERSDAAAEQKRKETESDHAVSAATLYEFENAQIERVIVTQCNKAINRLGSESERKAARAGLQALIRAWDSSASEGAEYAMTLYEATGDEGVFYDNPEYHFKSTLDIGGYEALLTPEVYLNMVKEMTEMIEEQRLYAKNTGYYNGFYDPSDERVLTKTAVKLCDNIDDNIKTIKTQYAMEYGVKKEGK